MAASAVEECTVDHVVQALNRRKSAGPTSLNQIRVALPKHLRQCDGALAEALRQGRVWQYGRVGKAEQYWTESPADFASSKVEKELRQTPGGLTEKDLVKLVSGALLKGVIEPRELISSLVSQGRLFVQPKINNRQRTVKYTLEPFEFVDQLVAELIAKVNRIAAEAGLDVDAAMERARSVLSSQPAPREPVLRQSAEEASPSVTDDSSPGSAAPPHSEVEISRLILQAMREVNPRVDDGDLVLIPELRQRLDFHQIEKSQFDRLLLSLFMARRVVLSKTSAGLVSDAERQQFVADEEGNFYNTVALWRD